MQSPVTEYKPCKSLNSFVEVFWKARFQTVTSGPLSLQMIPNGCVELIIHLNDLHCDLENNYGWSQSPDFMILGLFTQPYEVRFSGDVNVFAIRFKPEGFYNIFGVPASEFKERYEDMTLVKCNGFREFSNRIREGKSVSSMIKLTEIYLLKSLQNNKIDISYVNLAAQLIRSTKGLKIDEISSKIFISKRQLEREFKNKIGISPKHYLRITRINEVVRFLNSNQSFDLTSVAYHCGYFDQAHFIHDFKRITGQKPSIFFKERGLIIANPGLAHYIN